ncbi:UPF0280 family protein [Sphingopyxis sp. J-6]|uniref:UPF0280 family protein n=1 Tax=Sphingopyxis sp. J-6 TaxID=3122054 RepID=UPI003984131D
MAAARSRLPDGRWHFQHGPIDLVIGADGDGDAVSGGIEGAWARFSGLLHELAAELPLLRADVSAGQEPQGPVARRMWRAALMHRPYFITPMVAVAGAVAEEMIGYFRCEPGVSRAYVNNGGDIALHLTGRTRFRIGVFGDIARLCLEGASALSRHEAVIEVGADDGIGGIATSGWRGRSHSLGIADSVTVLAGDAATADAAATMIANAVDIADPRIVRTPASQIDSDSDLGARLVTRDVPPLDARAIEAAMESGLAEARKLMARGLIEQAYLQLQGHCRIVSASDGLNVSHPPIAA